MRRDIGRAECEVRVVPDVRIPGVGGSVLSADVYLPVVDEPRPALLSLYPYPKASMAEFLAVSLMWFARRGFACVLVDLQGTGSSDGVPRPRWDPAEGDDALAALRWMAEQPWCTGDLGMWGSSYGGALTMRAAARRPPGLKAIIPMMFPLDSRRYGVARTDMELLAQWGGMMLAQQLLPPMVDHTSEDAQRRWRERLDQTDPYFVDLARHGPSDPVWDDRVIDPGLVDVPALFVGGWRDPHSEPVVRSFERATGPRKLLMGPWGHEMPQDSVHDPVDFPAVAVRWWDYWLGGIENGVMDEPAVTICVMSDTSSSQWRSFERWPPAADDLLLGTGGDTALIAAASVEIGREEPVATYLPDATIGALSGHEGHDGESLLGQHDDDVRSVSFTSEPLSGDLVICGRPEITVKLVPHRSTDPTAVRRIVARLAEVGADGHSRLVTSSVSHPPTAASLHVTALKPVARRVRAGQRLRVVICDSDFPRLMPLVDPSPIQIVGVRVSIPVMPAEAGSRTDLPTVSSDTAATGQAAPGRPQTVSGGRWVITHDPVEDSIEVVSGGSTLGVRTKQGHQLHAHAEVRTSVRRSAPETATTAGTHTWTAHMNAGETITITASIRCTQTHLRAYGDININNRNYYTQSWQLPLAP